ncbi:ATP-binding protein [Streptomyces sp. 1222.5]|uniref:ATP-binding protein n=1 Tax=Streptomyces sp. 1222.5 TaxID=1881026 RepID=UPI003EC11F5A
MTFPTISPKRQPVCAAEDGQRTFGLLLDHGPLAPATARHEARPVLADWGLGEEQAYDALLVISELVTNAVTHALPPVILHLQAATDHCGHVQIHVSDGGHQPSPEAWAATRPDDEHGRGAAIISALADETGAAGDVDGLIDHWADIPAA